MSLKESSENGLSVVLRRFLNLVDDGLLLVLSTNEGIELMTVNKSETAEFIFDTVSSQIMAYCCTIDQPSKFGLGEPKYSLTWTENGIVMTSRLESLIITILLDNSSNLGMLELNMQLLHRILRPFCSPAFVNSIS
mmetsp:Transcript_21943/g.30148  ORF Transcript_21943/g.30148 Transcript_21943/m.30148 type:complete len:136 (+) Transcript_21943:51-458(+)